MNFNFFSILYTGCLIITFWSVLVDSGSQISPLVEEKTLFQNMSPSIRGSRALVRNSLAISKGGNETRHISSKTLVEFTQRESRTQLAEVETRVWYRNCRKTDIFMVRIIGLDGQRSPELELHKTERPMCWHCGGRTA